MLIFWKKNVFAYFLWPFSWLYRFLFFVRKQLYRFNIKKIHYFPVPVIVVGNLTVGGSGKTPLVIEIARFLKTQGFKPGVVTRGYGGKAQHYPLQVDEYSRPCEVGDEALLIIRSVDCPVFVDPQRTRAVKKLLAKKNCDVILSDDGLQHFALGRSLEIAVIDGDRRFGNGFCLPAGPLREPVSRLKSIKLKVTKGHAQENEFAMQLIPDYFYQLINPQNKQKAPYFYGKSLHAVAGIGNPEQFFKTLRALGLSFQAHPFPDHHFFKQKEFTFGEEVIIIMTEKDGVKCQGWVDPRLWCLKTKTKVDDRFFSALLMQLNQAK
jgi:tetraacyldisaccharide 4'-kinase